jgi:DNA-binding response OmpR family regulator
MQQILVIEDEEGTVELVEFILEQAGYGVTSARTGAAALQALAEIEPALALLDINMPGMSGLEVLKIVRQDMHLTFPILMMTAIGDVQMVKTALEGGANGYVLKPFRANVLVERVQSTLQPGS